MGDEETGTRGPQKVEGSTKGHMIGNCKSDGTREGAQTGNKGETIKNSFESGIMNLIFVN